MSGGDVTIFLSHDTYALTFLLISVDTSMTDPNLIVTRLTALTVHYIILLILIYKLIDHFLIGR